MSIPNPIIVDMEVVANNVPVSMQVATQYDLPITLEPLEADHNGDYSAPAGTAWDSAHVAVPGPSGTVQINANGTVDVEQYAFADVQVPNSYTQADEGKVVDNGALVAQTDETVTTNGTVNTTTVKQVTVDVTVDDTYVASNMMGTKITDIPDLSVLDRTNPVIYFIVDTSQYQLPLYSKFSVRPVGTGTITMSVGHFGQTGFVEDESETVASGAYYVKNLTDNGHRFWIFKLTSTGGDVTRCDNTTVAYVVNPTLIPVVALYGNFEKVTSYFTLNLYNCLICDVANIQDAQGRGLVTAEQSDLSIVKMTGAFAAVVNMFYPARRLQSADLSGVDLSASTTFAQIFYYCSYLKSVNLGTQNLSSATSIRNLFYGCFNLKTLNLANVNLSGVTETTGAFTGMIALSEITGWTNIPVSYSLADSTGLTHESLMVVINALPTVQTAQALTLGATNTAKLTAEEIAVATGKGWTVA